jgi:hypothetical protein
MKFDSCIVKNANILSFLAETAESGLVDIG